MSTNIESLRDRAASLGWHWFIMIAIGLGFVYFLPTIVANYKGRMNRAAIFALNLFLGWSLIGWVASLVWAISEPATVVSERGQLQFRKADGTVSPRWPETIFVGSVFAAILALTVYYEYYWCSGIIIVGVLMYPVGAWVCLLAGWISLESCSHDIHRILWRKWWFRCKYCDGPLCIECYPVFYSDLEKPLKCMNCGGLHHIKIVAN